MQDKTFEQALSELNQRELKEITDEAVHCWFTIQQGATVADATAHLKNVRMRESVSHVLFYIVLHSLLYNAKQHTLISDTRYEELKNYIDGLSELAKQQSFSVPLCTS
ncbi:MAG: hypothetical protein H0V70_17615 [Ktedonobacteraceae bacterium]|nr:hypothetical protein [Ktedonobacteraceae bacterium]